jgi:hypothetical protein
MQSGTNRALLALALLLLIAAGCRPAQPPKGPTVTVRGGTGGDQGFNGPIDTDPCAARLQSVIGQLYAYYLANHRFPDRLDELATYADFDQVPDYNCPTSHQPYAYAPNGLESVNIPGHLIVFDSSPVHQNTRWAIIVRPPPRGQQTMTMEVVRVSEPVFQSFQPVRVAPQLPPASAPAGSGS